MSKYYVLGNWKSNGSRAQVETFQQGFTPEVSGTELVTGLALPVHLIEGLPGGHVAWRGAQDVSQFGEGAFTGQITANMLTDLGSRFCLVGHSERRQYFGETVASTAAKIGKLLEASILPVLCIGESLEQRRAGQLQAVLREQLAPLGDLAAGTNIVIAYEPIWAIGTGVAAQPEDVETTHGDIKAMLADFGFENTSVLYGGSVKPGNAADLAALSAVDGFLVGGASLKAADFSAVLAGFQTAKQI